MSRTRRLVKVPPEQVWEVLADGWMYPLWVVGAARMREVDDTWPAPGSKLHHSVGLWPALLDDETVVRACEPGRMLRLRARGWPAGEADVVITLTPQDGGTLVEIEEDAVKGPGRLMPKPVRAPLIAWRNVESLRRLAHVAERR